MTRVIRLLTRLQPATLYGQMLLLVLGVVLVQLVISGAIFATLIGNISEKQIGRRALDIAHTLARAPSVQSALSQPSPPRPPFSTWPKTSASRPGRSTSW